MDKPRGERNFFEELMVVLVIFKMEINESPAFHSLTRALQSVHHKSSIFIYDNSPHTHNCPSHENWVITYRNDPANPGVSKAYNEGLRMAKSQNKKWLLLADQDTVFPNDFFEPTSIAVANNPKEELLCPIVRSGSALISPFKFKFGRGIALKTIAAQSYTLDDLKFINSGLLISTTLFEKCGGYDERFNLDFSDLAFIERLRKYQDNFVVINSICAHSLSSDEKILSKSLDRFSHFVRASRLYGDAFDLPYFLFANRVLRAVKLSFYFRSLEFIKSLRNG